MVPDDYIQPEKHPNLLIINGITSDLGFGVPIF